MPDAAYGELCQCYPYSFTVSKSKISSLIERPIDDDEDDANSPSDGNITFNCAEQFMMYCKLTACFTDDSWDKVKSDVVVAGNVVKFGHEYKLRRRLLATGDRLLVEAASRDRVWGIGYSAKHAMSYRQHWGENRLGRALMQTREQLRKEQEVALARENWEDTAIITSSKQ
ncbi:hypothetical protein VM1G_06276 [Cytospora mali]|uniref:NADAR domain-containing protein n=1 Tax=Cytospora mali TaxID=578113 RepID=A0A194W220_CYTMA|nr:hypothetical protein VM1G_06276 [Valsa mali]